jgi:hypothetical protein
LRFRHHHKILFATDRVGGASVQHQSDEDDQDCDEFIHYGYPENKKAAYAAF